MRKIILNNHISKGINLYLFIFAFSDYIHKITKIKTNQLNNGQTKNWSRNRTNEAKCQSS